MKDYKSKFKLDFPENFKNKANLPQTAELAFDDLAEFIDERKKIEKALEDKLSTNLKVDYSNFDNHVFFDSALQKFTIAKNKILRDYPYNGTYQNHADFAFSCSSYENYVLEKEWPKSVGYLSLNSSSDNYVTGIDYDDKLFIGSSSFMFVFAVNKSSTASGTLFQLISGSNQGGYDFYFNSTTSNFEVTAYSGSFSEQLSASYPSNATFTIGYLVDRNISKHYLYFNDIIVSSGSYTLQDINNKAPTTFYVGLNYSGSIDDVRIYNTCSHDYYLRDWRNSTPYSDNMVLHYSFNEGLTGISSIDSTVVDYSKSNIPGIINNYSSGVRVSGSLLYKEKGTPTLYRSAPEITAYTASIEASASLRDSSNPNLIFNLLPPYLLREDDDKQGLLTSFSLAMARYFDELKLYVDQFSNLRTTNYGDFDQTPDLFLPYLKRYFSWKVTEHFNEANPLEFFFGQNIITSSSLEVPLYEIRNQFWRRILNNLPYLYATKGKRNNIESYFNILGINRENINIKEYGYLAGGSLQDSYIVKEKISDVLAFTASSLDQYLKVSNFTSGSTAQSLSGGFTVEMWVELPWVSASYNYPYNVGDLWNFTKTGNPNDLAFFWSRPTAVSSKANFYLGSYSGSDFLSSSLIESSIDGDFIYLAAGLDHNKIPFIETRKVVDGVIDSSGSFTGSIPFLSPLTGTTDFVMGSFSGSFLGNAGGYFSQFKVWNRKLTNQEINNHALNFESVGEDNPISITSSLYAQYPLFDNISSSAGGVISNILDLSRNGRSATGYNFPASYNSNKKFLRKYSYLSPSIDLKWTDNKVRIRNKTALKKSEIANDTNEVAIEFNFIDSLNEDIMKIFSSFDVLNNIIGSGINKYKGEYAQLENLRSRYFEKMGDGLNFNNFFKLFTWFDSKISDSVKQLLPANVRFIGGEQIVESHFLERPKYKFQYPVFRTPVDIPEVSINSEVEIVGTKVQNMEGSIESNNLINLDGKVDSVLLKNDIIFDLELVLGSSLAQTNVSSYYINTMAYNTGSAYPMAKIID